MKIAYAVNVREGDCLRDDLEFLDDGDDGESWVHWYWTGQAWDPRVRQAKLFAVKGEAQSISDEFNLKGKRPHGTDGKVEVIKVYILQRIEPKAKP